MAKQLDDLEYDLLSDANQNKYVVFEEVRRFLDCNGIIWEHMLQLLRKSDSGYLNYSFGDLEISFQRVEYFSEEREEPEDAIQLMIETQKGSLQKNATYTYSIPDLAQLKRMKQSRIDSFGE
jgi:hypothetical protein